MVLILCFFYWMGDLNWDAHTINEKSSIAVISFYDGINYTTVYKLKKKSISIIGKMISIVISKISIIGKNVVQN